MKTKKIGYRIFIGLGLILFSAALLIVLYLASRMRLSGDDYCYQSVLVREGFWGMQARSFVAVSMYNGNRFALNFFAGLVGLLPAWGSGAFVILALLGWLGALFWLVGAAAKKAHIQLQFLEKLVMAEAFACFVLWGMPNMDQSLFWLSGMLPYFMPLLGGTLLAALALQVDWDGPGRGVFAGLLFVLALVTGGFSETGAALQAGFWGLALMVGLAASLKKWPWGKALIWPALSIVLGTLGAAALLYFSPSTALRMAEMPEGLGLQAFISLLLLNLKVYFWNLVHFQLLTLLAPLAFGLGLGWARQPFPGQQSKADLPFWQALLMLIGIGLVCLFLTACVMIPGTFVFADYPPDRAFVLSQTALAGGLLAMGFLFSWWVRQRLPEKVGLAARWLGLVLLFASLLAAYFVLQNGFSNARKFTRWADLWDQRHQILLAAGQTGQDAVHVMALDHIIQDVGELSADPDYWYNNCAEMFYDVDQIYADQPGW